MKFSLLKQEFAEIVASEVAGVVTGMLGAGTVASASVRAISYLLNHTAELYLPDSPYTPSDDFLNQNPLSIQGLYDREKLVADRLLYVEMYRFVDKIIDTGSVRIDITPSHEVFRLKPFEQPEIEALRNQGFEALRACGKYRYPSDVIRLDKVDETDDGVNLFIRKAAYQDQARSNLILDFRGPDHDRTLRQTLQNEMRGFLPDLDDNRLANSLGLTILVFYRDDAGIWTPFLVPRSRQVAVLNRGLWSDSASGAAEWPRYPDETPSTFEAYVLDDLHKEMKDEIGLLPDDMIAILPTAMARELIRAGKPQLFFIGFTRLDRKELLKRLNDARRENRKNPIEPEEIYRMPTFRTPPKIGQGARIQSEYERLLVDPQCAASLYYAHDFLNQLVNSPYWKEVSS